MRLLGNAINHLLLCAVIFTPVFGSAQAIRPEKPADLNVLISGNPEDKVVELTEGPVAILMGGGPEVDRAFQKHAFPIIKGGDIVVLRVSRLGGYNPYFYDDLAEGNLKPDSVETIQLDTAEQANSDYVAWAIETAEMVWIAGGDQSAYLEAWRGTRAQKALQSVWDKGGVVGGTSAGLAILGQFIFDPLNVDATNSVGSIQNPYNSGAIISDRFINIPYLDHTITETHFRNRDRMGRTLGFMAVIREENRAPIMRAVCVSESSAITIKKNGIGEVDADEEVYILMETVDTKRENVNPDEPLIYGPVQRVRLVDGDQFNFNTWSSLKPALEIAVNGSTVIPASYYEDVNEEATSGLSPQQLIGN
ncbi:MAG: cyanophycinase [Sumerlaeia bacterium]